MDWRDEIEEETELGFEKHLMTIEGFLAEIGGNLELKSEIITFSRVGLEAEE